MINQTNTIMNVAKRFEETVLCFPEDTAVVFNGKQYSYRELNEETNILATPKKF